MEQNEIQQKNSLKGGEKRKPLLKVSEADIEDESDSMPEYAFDTKATSNIREFNEPSTYKKKYGNNGYSNHNGNGLGFVEDDLNVAIESLVGENT